MPEIGHTLRPSGHRACQSAGKRLCMGCMTIKKRKYWSGVLAMLGVALVATAVFAKENWIFGLGLGIVSLIVGAKLDKGDE